MILSVSSPRGQHQDGEEVILPDALAERKAVHVRQHDVQDDQAQLLAGDDLQRLGRRAAGEHRIPLVCQVDFHKVRNGGLVVDNQDFFLHGNVQFPSFFPAL